MKWMSASSWLAVLFDSVSWQVDNSQTDSKRYSDASKFRQTPLWLNGCFTMTHDREPVTRPLHVAPKCWLFLSGNEMKNLILKKMNIYQRSLHKVLIRPLWNILYKNRNYAKLIINSCFFKGSFKKIISLFKT